jgi:hypothetical protein
MIEVAVIELLKKSVRPQARMSEGASFVEYGRPFKAVAAVTWILVLAIAIICFHPPNDIELEATIFIVGGFLVVALFVHSEFFLVRITYDGVGVIVYERWGNEKRIGWHEISSVHFSKPSQNYVVGLNNEQKFTFNYLMSGYQSLLANIEERLRLSECIRKGSGLAK